MKHSSPSLRYLEERLRSLDSQGLLRRRPLPVAEVALSFCSNDYLGLASATALPAAVGAGAARLIVGEREEHGALERALAAWLDLPAALLFSSGYAANVGVLSALAEPGDLVVSDRLNHASIIDGCRLSRATVEVVDHLSLAGVEKALNRPRSGRAWVVTESYFSMDADTPDLRGLRHVCDANDAALVVDEAHSVGVFGPRATGLCADAGIVPGRLHWHPSAKPFGVRMLGRFAAGSVAARGLALESRPLVRLLDRDEPGHRRVGRLSSLQRILDDDAPRRRLWDNVRRLRAGLGDLGVDGRGHGPIVPIVVGDPAAAKAPRRRGATGGRESTCRPSGPRRCTQSGPRGSGPRRRPARHTDEDIDRALVAISRTLPWPTSSS